MERELSQILKVNDEKIVSQEVDDEVIIINVETGTYYSLREVGLSVWHGLESEPTPRQLIDWLGRRYEVSTEELTASVNALLEELKKEEIVILKSGESSAQELPQGQPEKPQPFTTPELEKFTNMSDLLLLDPIHDVNEQGWPVQKTT